MTNIDYKQLLMDANQRNDNDQKIIEKYETAGFFMRLKYLLTGTLIKEEFEIGSIRTKRKFLLFPKIINWKIKWLCYATWKEEYMTLSVMPPEGIPKDWYYDSWQAIKWIK